MKSRAKEVDMVKVNREESFVEQSDPVASTELALYVK